MLLVGARGFEPPTSRSQTERTTRLCYAPNCLLIKQASILLARLTRVKLLSKKIKQWRFINTVLQRGDRTGHSLGKPFKRFPLLRVL